MNVVFDIKLLAFNIAILLIELMDVKSDNCMSKTTFFNVVLHSLEVQCDFLVSKITKWY